MQSSKKIHAWAQMQVPLWLKITAYALELDKRGIYIDNFIIWASTQESLSSGFANNKSANQPVHPCSLINSFVIRFMESIISSLATREVWFF